MQLITRAARQCHASHGGMRGVLREAEHCPAVQGSTKAHPRTTYSSDTAYLQPINGQSTAHKRPTQTRLPRAAVSLCNDVSRLHCIPILLQPLELQQ